MLNYSFGFRYPFKNNTRKYIFKKTLILLVNNIPSHNITRNNNRALMNYLFMSELNNQQSYLILIPLLKLLILYFKVLIPHVPMAFKYLGKRFKNQSGHATPLRLWSKHAFTINMILNILNYYMNNWTHALSEQSRAYQSLSSCTSTRVAKCPPFLGFVSGL